jgi:hypothetical protein
VARVAVGATPLLLLLLFRHFETSPANYARLTTMLTTKLLQLWMELLRVMLLRVMLLLL